MTDLVLDDLKPGLVARLEVRALSNGRTLEEEVRAILEEAACLPMEEAVHSGPEEQVARPAEQVTGTAT